MITLILNKFFKNSKQTRLLQTWLANHWFELKTEKYKKSWKHLAKTAIFSNYFHASFHQKDFFSIQISSLFAINYWIIFHLNEKLIRPIFQLFRHQLRQKSFTHEKLPLMKSAARSPFQALGFRDFWRFVGWVSEVYKETWLLRDWKFSMAQGSKPDKKICFFLFSESFFLYFFVVRFIRIEPKSFN